MENATQPGAEEDSEGVVRETPRVNEVLDIVKRVCALGNYDSNVIGMAAEVIAEDVFGMKKVARGKQDVDGVWLRSGALRTVQVKAWSELRVETYREGTYFDIKETTASEDLLVLLIYSSKADYKVLYRGPTKNVGNISASGVQRRVYMKSMLSIEESQRLFEEIRISRHSY